MLNLASNEFREVAADRMFRKFYDIERKPVVGFLVAPQLIVMCALGAMNFFTASCFFSETEKEKERCWQLGKRCSFVLANQILNFCTLGLLNNFLLCALVESKQAKD